MDHRLVIAEKSPKPVRRRFERMLRAIAICIRPERVSERRPRRAAWSGIDEHLEQLEWLFLHLAAGRVRAVRGHDAHAVQRLHAYAPGPCFGRTGLPRGRYVARRDEVANVID